MRPAAHLHLHRLLLDSQMTLMKHTKGRSDIQHMTPTHSVSRCFQQSSAISLRRRLHPMPTMRIPQAPRTMSAKPGGISNMSSSVTQHCQKIGGLRLNRLEGSLVSYPIRHYTWKRLQPWMTLMWRIMWSLRALRRSYFI